MAGTALPGIDPQAGMPPEGPPPGAPTPPQAPPQEAPPIPPSMDAMGRPAIKQLDLPKAARKLLEFIDSKNIAESLPEEKLAEIGRDVAEGAERDWNTYSGWRETMKDVVKLVKMERESKSHPWPDAANVKFPLIAEASMQFAARAYPEIVQGSQVVRACIYGEDPDRHKEKRAKRISQHMSWQILEEMPAWESNMDSLLHMLPIYGTVYKKTYYDQLLKKNVSIALTPFEVAVNDNVRDNTNPRRMTHILRLHENEVIERIRGGLWLDQELGEGEETTHGDLEEAQAGVEPDDASFHTFYEQHCWLDLDDDGYQEPYIVTVHKLTSSVVRIVAGYDRKSVLFEEGKLVRITAVEYFTKFVFLPNPAGGWLGAGFGQLLCATNDAINSIINQLIDSGTLANLQGGFKSKDAKVSGDDPIEPGEWRSTDISAQDLQSAFFPLPYKEPSMVLYQLLGLLVTAGEKFASSTASMSGSEMPANATATSVLAVIDQGMKVFSGIHKRVYRSLRDEFRKLAWLNARYMDDAQYFRIVGNPEAMRVGRMDYALGDFDVIPVADPAMATSVQKIARAQALQEWSKGKAGVNMYAVDQMFLNALGVSDSDVERVLIPPDKQAPPPPDPMLLDVQAKMKAAEQLFQIESKKMEQAQAKLAQEKEKQDAEVKNILAQALLAIAKAEAAEAGPQLEEYKVKLQELSDHFDRSATLAQHTREQDDMEHRQEMERIAAAQAAQDAPAEGAELGS